MAHGRERRERWTNRYQRMDGEQFGWFLPVAPRQLIELLDGPSAPKPGRALDLGCGPGVATCELSGRFDQAVGLDYAYPALERARERLAAEGRTAWLLAADAAGLPFCGGSFNLLFDRGCLQNIPRGRWEAYFREVTRVLTLEGVLQLLCSRTTRRPKLLSARGIKVRLRAVVSEPTRLSGPQWLSHDLLRQLAEPGLVVDTLEDFPFVTRGGDQRTFTHAIFRRIAA